jgi:hypothetical protein
MEDNIQILLSDLIHKMNVLPAGNATTEAMRSADKVKLYLEGDFKNLWYMEYEDKQREMKEQLTTLGANILDILEEKKVLEDRLEDAKKKIKDLEFRLKLHVTLGLTTKPGDVY